MTPSWQQALSSLVAAKASDALIALAVKEALAGGRHPTTPPTPQEPVFSASPPHSAPPGPVSTKQAGPPAPVSAEWKLVNWYKPDGGRSSIRLTTGAWNAAQRRAAQAGLDPSDWIQRETSALYANGEKVGPAMQKLLDAPD